MAGVNLKTLKRHEIENILQGIDTILSDCDGVLWFDANVTKDHPMAIKNVPETVIKLKQSGKRFFYVTNNPKERRQGFIAISKRMGYDPKPQEIITAAYLVAKYLQNVKFNKKVYVIGGDGIEVGAVVVSFDEHVSYPKLVKAAKYLSDPSVLFLATSVDLRIPVATGVVPGPGALIKYIEACSGRKATVLGKPEPFIRKVVVDTFNVTPETTLFIGDNAHTDVLTGKRCGTKTLLVLSGIFKSDDIKVWTESDNLETKDLIPDYYTDSLADLLPYL